MNAFAYHFGFEFRVGIRNKALMLMNYLFPLGCYLMFGALMGSINPGFLQTIVPAMSVFAVLSGALLGMPDTLVNAREAGIFRSYKINGVPALNILVVPVLTSMLHALLVTAIIALTAPALFDGVAPANWAGFLLVFLVTAFALAGLGALIGVVSTSSRMTVLLSQLVFLPSMILGGLMLPSSLLTGALGKVALLLPTTYAMDAFAGLAMGQGTGSHAWQSVGILLAGGLMAFGLALFLFSWDSKNSTRRGHPALALLAWLPYVIGLLLAH
ncbi:MAG: ABC transporter permease [Chloroflexi bacterium]|jgi:ABC-2 type transport system permease protein|nr:ABC transporter permease [Chloroflexota bacterium]